jgi:predicted O-methyltransferase YrrM
MSVDEAVKAALKIPGFYSEGELTLLASLAHGLAKDSSIVEIGVENGRSATVLMNAAPKIRWVYLIDSNITTMALSLPRSSRTIVIETTSAELALGWTEERRWPLIDLLHIDADHEAGEDRGPWLDCKLWLPKVKSGGIVAFHDYKRPSPGGEVFPAVTKAVDHFTQGWEQLGLVETLIAKRKP